MERVKPFLYMYYCQQKTNEVIVTVKLSTYAGVLTTLLLVYCQTRSMGYLTFLLLSDLAVYNFYSL